MKEEKTKFSEQEYLSIRNEMIQRINTINSQTSTAIVTILSAWAVGLTLSLELVEGNYVNSENILAIIIIRTFVFLIPIFYFIPLAARSGENITQVVSISAYIRVFYDYLSFKNNNLKMNWETSNNIMSAINVDRKNKESKMMKFCNETYTVLALCSFVFYLIFSVFSIKTVFDLFGSLSGHIFTFFVLLLSVIAIISIIRIHKSSCTKINMMEKTKVYVMGYIKRAKELGVFSDDDVIDATKKLNPDNYYQ